MTTDNKGVQPTLCKTHKTGKPVIASFVYFFLIKDVLHSVNVFLNFKLK